MDIVFVIGLVIVGIWLFAPRNTTERHQGHRGHRCGRWCRCRWFR